MFGSYKNQLVSTNITLTKPFNILAKQFIDKGKFSTIATFDSTTILDNGITIKELYGDGVKLVDEFDFKSHETDTTYTYYPNDPVLMGVYALLNPNDPISLYHDTNKFVVHTKSYTNYTLNTTITYNPPDTIIPNDTILGRVGNCFFTRWLCGVVSEKNPFSEGEKEYIVKWYPLVRYDGSFVITKDIYLKNFTNIFDTIIAENSQAWSGILDIALKGIMFYSIISTTAIFGTAIANGGSIINGLEAVGMDMLGANSTYTLATTIGSEAISLAGVVSIGMQTYSISSMTQSTQATTLANDTITTNTILYQDNNYSLPQYDLPIF